MYNDVRVVPLAPTVTFTGEVNADSLNALAELFLVGSSEDEGPTIPDELPALVLPKIYTHTTPIAQYIHPAIAHEGKVIWHERVENKKGSTVRAIQENGGMFVVRSVLSIRRQSAHEAIWKSYDDDTYFRELSSSNIWLTAIGEVAVSGIGTKTPDITIIASPNSKSSTGHLFKT